MLFRSGTNIAGIISADHNLDENQCGLNPYSKIINIRSNNSSNATDFEGISSAIDYAVSSGAKIINCSFGYAPDNQLVKVSIDNAVNSGVIFVCGVSNEDRDDLDYPAAYDSTIAVTGLNKGLDARGTYAYESYINFAMPAQKINTTDIPNTNGNYTNPSGTSFSTPIVTAIVSRLLSNDPTMTREQVLEKLSQHSVQLPDGGSETGYGRIDVKSLALSYVNIEEKKISTVINNEDVILEFKVVNDKATNEVTRKVLEYM